VKRPPLGLREEGGEDLLAGGIAPYRFGLRKVILLVMMIVVVIVMVVVVRERRE